MTTRRRPKSEDVLQIACLRVGFLADGALQCTVVYPGKKIPTVPHRAFEEIDLWAEPVVGDDYYPASAQAVFDLVLIDHFRGA